MSTATAGQYTVTSSPDRRDIATTLVRWTGGGLIVSALTSALLFGLYILAFYAAAVSDGNLAQWNDALPGLYVEGARGATAGIGLHFAAGGVILVLGGLQFIGAIRTRYAWVHRWIGRVYVGAAVAAGVGGLAFIGLNGTIGGAVMNIGFALYGVLMIVAAVPTYLHARTRRVEVHRAWALRLFALAIGSWLYRIEYGFWLMLTNGLGASRDFRGPFDYVMAFFFYLPNLAVTEVFIRARPRQVPAAIKYAAAAVLAGATGFLVLGTYYFTRLYWGPAILRRLGI